MKILFTAAPFFSRRDSLGSPEGETDIATSIPVSAPYYLGSLLQALGHEVTIVDAMDMPNLWHDPVGSARLFRQFDLICISSNSFTYWCAKTLLDSLAGEKDLPPIVMGGAHATHYGDHILRTTPVSYAVRGEGERALTQLVQALAGKIPIDQVCNLIYKDQGTILRTADGPAMTAEELAEMPLPLWEQLPPKRYFCLPIESSRGCLFSCTFCSILLIRQWKGFPEQALLRRVDHAIKHLIAARGAENMQDKGAAIFFTDDCFTTDKQRLGELCQELGKREVSYGFEGRATDLIKPGVMDDLTGMSINYLFAGIECGYEAGLKKVRKGTKLEHVERCAQMVREYGINACTSFGFIQGFPWEGTREVKETLSYAINSAARYGHRVNLAWLSYLPGSELYDRAVNGEYGFRIVAEDYDEPFYGRETSFFARTHPSLGPAEIAEIQQFANSLLDERILGVESENGAEVEIAGNSNEASAAA